LGLKLNKPERCLTSADGSDLNIKGVCDVNIKGTYSSIDTEIYVLKGSKRNLLGVPELTGLNLLAVVNAMCSNEFDPIKQFPKLFKGLGIMPGLFKIELKADVKPVRLFSPRPIAAGLRKAAKDEIDQMLDKGVIEPVEQATDWCSGLTIVPKPNGKIRMCVDLTNVNKGIRREIYPLPRVSDMLSNLSEGVMFSKLDANAGFWQVVMDPESRLLTTFITPWGRFCFRRMPFGVSSAPEFYQRAMEKILKGLKGVICLMDDILVYGKNPSDHWYRLKKVLKRIEKAGMTLRKEKCQFGCSEIKFLGHIISGTGIKADPDKIKAIVEMSPPTTKKEARRFTGMTNYLMKFSSKLAELCVPIHEISGSKSEWFWGPDQQKAFQAVKAEITKAPVLIPFDLNGKHRVSADASKSSLGAVLLQLNETRGLWQPVEYASRKMTETEQRYAMIEKEALAITWACEKFDYYLVGRKFEIESDHKPLIAILGEKDLSCLPVRVQRFKLRLMRYEYDIFHTPGKNMFLADSLSRPNASQISDDEIIQCGDVETYVHSVVAMSAYSDVKLQEVKDSMGKDTVAVRFVRYMHAGWPESSFPLEDELAKLYAARDRITLYDDLLLYNERIYIPVALREKYLELCHEGHQGISKCRRRALRHFWWPGVGKEIADYISRCNVCIMHSQIMHEPMVETELPLRPWEVIGSDVFMFNGSLFVVMIDYYSKWIEALPIESQTSNAVIRAMKEVFSRFGIPNVIRSDNGSCYDSKRFREFAVESGFILATSSPRYPPSNGLAESAVKTVKRLWKKCDDKGVALMAYRTTPLPAGFSPSDLMFGRPIRSSIGIPYETDIDYGQFEEVEVRRKKKLKRKWDKKYRVSNLPRLTPGQIVHVKAPTDVGSKGVVLREDNSPNSYWVKVGQSEIRRNRKHLFLLHSENEEKKGEAVHDRPVENSSGSTEYDEDDSDDEQPPERVVELDGQPEPDPPVGVPIGGHADVTIGGSSRSDPVVEADDQVPGFEAVENRSRVTRRGRISAPPKRYDDVYYK
jgi:hypothetical protein